MPDASLTDTKAYEEKVSLTREIAGFLRKNVVQAVKAEPTSAKEGERWRTSKTRSETLPVVYLLGQIYESLSTPSLAQTTP